MGNAAALQPNRAHMDSAPCVICLEDISEQATALPCNHDNFDFLCLATWLQQTSTCPLCKVGITSVEYWDDHARQKVYKVNSTVPIAQSQTQLDISRCSSSGGAEPPDWIQSSRAGQNLSSRQSTSRRRRHRPPPPPSEQEILIRRKRIYELGLYSLHVGSNRLSGYSDLTPVKFAGNPHLISRARKWIRRELRVFDHFNSPAAGQTNRHSRSYGQVGDEQRQRASSNAEFLLEYMVAILKTVDIKGSGGQAQQMLADFLGTKSALFLHELNSWLRSPFEDLAVWDRNVRYEWPDEDERATKRAAAGRSPTDDEDDGDDDDDDEDHSERRKRRRTDRWVPD